MCLPLHRSARAAGPERRDEGFGSPRSSSWPGGRESKAKVLAEPVSGETVLLFADGRLLLCPRMVDRERGPLLRLESAHGGGAPHDLL